MKYLYTVELINDVLANTIAFRDTKEEVHEINLEQSGNLTITINKINSQFSVPPEFDKSVTWGAGSWRNISKEVIVDGHEPS